MSWYIQVRKAENIKELLRSMSGNEMPNYFGTNEKIKVGDKIVLGGLPGKVVFVLDDDQYSPDYPKEAWEYLKKESDGSGAMLLLDNGTLILEYVDREDLALKVR